MSKSETVKEVAAIHLARGEIYTFCNKCFLLPPCEDIYRIIDEISKKLVLLSDNSESYDIKEGVKELVDFLAKRKNMASDDRSKFDIDVLREFTSLFCLTNSVQTDESYYTSVDKRLCQESRDKMVLLLKKHSFKLAENANEYEDHISVELSFMAQLAFDSADMLSKGDYESYNKLIVEQKEFHANHFDKWINIFFDEVIEFHLENELLYKSLAKFTKGFLAEDKILLTELSTI